MQAHSTAIAIPTAPVDTPALPKRLPARQAMLEGPILPTMLRFAVPTVTVLVAQTLVSR
jgi:hypothetical protein